jgi:ATP-dependent helicase HrpA
VTVHIPLPVLAQVRPDGFDWQVPGLRANLVTALIRSLPKALRRNFVPVPEFAASFLDAAPAAPPAGPPPLSLPNALAAHLRRLVGVAIGRGDWGLDRVGEHLRMTFRVLDADGAVVAQGKDLVALQRQLLPKARDAVAELADDIERDGLTAWTPGTLARVVERRRAGYPVKAYPALVDRTDSGAVRVFPTEEEQARAMWAGTRRLLMLEVPTPVPTLSRRLTPAVKLGLTRYPYQNVPDLLEDCVTCAVDTIVERAGGPAWDTDGYARLRDAVRAELPDVTAEVVRVTEQVVAAAHEVRGRLAAAFPPAQQASVEDMRAQLVALVQPGFVTAAGWRHLRDVPRYLAGIGRRLEKLAANPARDGQWMDDVAQVRAEYDDLLAALPPGRREDADVREVRWMLEELRISLFAQELRTAYPVSPVRIYRVLDGLRDAGANR